MRKLNLISVYILVTIFISACVERKTEPPFEQEFTLHIKAATMREAALQFTEQIGVAFRLSKEYKPDQIMRDEFFIYFPQAKLKDHIKDLKEAYIADIRWEKDHFTIYPVPLQ